MAKKKKQKESKYEQKKAEETLRESEEKYRKLFEEITDAMFVADAETGILTDCNRAASELVGREKLELIGKHQRILHPPQEIEAGFSRTFKQHLREKGGQVLEAKVITKNGEIKHVAIRANLFELKGKKQIQAIFRDITERKRMEEELQKAYDRVEKEVEERTKELLSAKGDLEIQTWGLKKTNEGIRVLYKELEKKNKELQRLNELKDEFLSNVSHELATPLTIIKEGVRLVSDEMLGKVNEQQKEFLTIANTNVDRLTRLIVDLLDLSKIEAGKIEIKKTSIDIKSLIRKLASSFELKVEQKKLELRVNLPEEEIDIYADEHRITQVFSNLVDNAIKFTKEGCIEISVREEGSEFECSVADTGTGISRKNIAKIFDKFTQLGRKPGPGEKGTGLGLAISRRIVELHRGRMWVESQPGRGSRFYFSLPKSSSQEKKKDSNT